MELNVNNSLITNSTSKSTRILNKPLETSTQTTFSFLESCAVKDEVDLKMIHQQFLLVVSTADKTISYSLV